MNWMSQARHSAGNNKKLEGLTEQQYLTVVHRQINKESKSTRDVLRGAASIAAWDAKMENIKQESRFAVHALFERFANGRHCDLPALKTVQAQEQAQIPYMLSALAEQEQRIRKGTFLAAGMSAEEKDAMVQSLQR